MLVVAPIAILVIAGLVSLMINFVGDALMSQQRSSATYEAQNGLDQVEQDIRLSSAVLWTTGALPSPQGSGASQTTAAFNAGSTTLDSTNALILSAYATTANPIAATSAAPPTLVYTNTPVNPCPTPYTTNNPLSYKIVYFVYNGSLWRRTIVPTAATTCGGIIPWQKNSCTVAASCVTDDRLIVSNVSSVTVTYSTEVALPYSSTVTAPPLDASDNPTSVKMTVTTSKNVAGGTISATTSIYATRLISSSAEGNTAVPSNTNLIADFAMWTTATGMTYNASTNEMVCTASGGSASSPLVRVDSAVWGAFKFEGYATTASPTRPYSGVYAGTYYYAADGTTAAYNTDPNGPYAANGHAPPMPAPLSSWHPMTMTFTLGPAIINTRVNLYCDSTNYTSDTHYRNPTLTITR